MRTAHVVLTVILLIIYFGIALRLLSKKKRVIGSTELTMAQFARMALLLTYLNGLILSMNMKLPVAANHHYVSLIPASVMLVFQFLPKKHKHGLGMIGYAIMFILMGISVIIIAATT